MKKQLECYIYACVSTSMQVDGYSLDAQKDKLHKYADYQDMIIAGEYSDEGKSGKSVEDGIDSSKDAGKLIISVLSAVAEIERENILVQTMKGRRQKAREGKWNGGFAPYGYQLVGGELHIAEDEAEII